MFAGITYSVKNSYSFNNLSAISPSIGTIITLCCADKSWIAAVGRPAVKNATSTCLSFNPEDASEKDKNLALISSSKSKPAAAIICLALASTPEPIAPTAIFLPLRSAKVLIFSSVVTI